MSDRPKAIILDVYNTLFHNEAELWKTTFSEICSTQGLEIGSEELRERWKRLEVDFRRRRTNMDDPDSSPPFKSYEQAWRECFEAVYEEIGAGDAAAAAHMAVRDMGRREPFTETVEALDEIKDVARLAIVSNADDSFLLPLIRGYAFQGLEVVLSSEAARAYKPHPKPFTIALERMALDPRETLYVGDHLFDDILGAGNVGMTTVWINRDGHSHDHELPEPDYTISNLMELIKLVNSG